MRTAVVSAGLRAATALAVLLGVLTAAAPSAAAHTDLVASTPQPGATVDTLDEIRLQLETSLQRDGRHVIRLLGPDGAQWDNGQTRAVADRELLAGAAPALPRQGEYTVRWCAVTADGHVQSGAYKFSYAGPTSATARPPGRTSDGGGCEVPSWGGAAALTGWLLVGVIAAAVLFLAASALLRRRVSPDHGERTGG
ncbi:MAG: hypothetical protein GEU83_13465 [Pseudonocardiaceae bacterium]|nr:hypothetical protein [Pseudonocardiaceae bacterium]